MPNSSAIKVSMPMPNVHASGRLIITNILYSVIFSILANCFIFINDSVLLIILAVVIFLVLDLTAGFKSVNTKSRLLRLCNHGTTLLISFCASIVVSSIMHILLYMDVIGHTGNELIGSVIFCVILNVILFWTGIICVYMTSIQLGIKTRVLGIICGPIPVANLVMLSIIIRTALYEIVLESEKEKIDDNRLSKQICATKYPVLMVHGVFFRDRKLMNYWGRIPKELEKNGAKLYYGNQQSAATVAKSGEEIACRIKKIIEETGCEKVNIIAHSKGGLDSRYALAHCGVSQYVASLTTINTPHRGCMFADWLLGKISNGVKDTVSNAYNKCAKVLGDDTPSFMDAVNNLTSEFCTEFDKTTPLPEGVYTQSVGSVMAKPGSGKFPLNMSYMFVKLFDGKNDGLVSENSFEWGEKFITLEPCGIRGISHGDVIDLNRENIRGFDVKEFYVKLLSDLKERGF